MIWVIRVGHGLFVVRTRSEGEARDVALTGEDGLYGHTLDDIASVTRLDPEGLSRVLAGHYG